MKVGDFAVERLYAWAFAASTAIQAMSSKA
jgi:hypothetical protein